MRDLFKQFFVYNKRERNGILVLLVLLLMLLIAPYLIPYLPVGKEEFDYSDFAAEIAEFKRQQQLLAAGEVEEKSTTKVLERETIPVELFPFDPNDASFDDLRRLGLHPKIAHTIINYRDKGGIFRYKTDIQKIYGFSNDDYTRLEAYISLPEEVTTPVIKSVKDEVKPSVDRAPPEPVVVELNSADSLQLIALRGIGPVYSSRILQYRDRLGGFAKKEQLLEVYGIDSVLLEQVTPYIMLQSEDIARLSVNTASVDELAGHPYISYNLARQMVNYRKHHGQYKNVDDIRKLYLVDDDIFKKISPYLTVK